MIWKILEHKSLAKTMAKLPGHIVKKYELWKRLIVLNGPTILKTFPGFQDEALQGERKWQRSSRLSLKYRVIYRLENDEVKVYVIEITAHKY
jgi:mRNA-degrading endonuclease RelE of RelBE toxin-antitoxin system